MDDELSTTRLRLQRLEARALRERAAREEAERIGESATRRLYDAAEAARSAARRYEVLLGATADGVVAIGADERVTFANPAACAFTGYGEAEILGLPAGQLVADVRPIRRALSDRESQRVADGGFRRRDGSGFPADYSADPLGVDEVVVVFRDVTGARVAAASRENEALARRQSAIARIGSLALREREVASVASALGQEMVAVLGVRSAVVLRAVGAEAELLGGEGLPAPVGARARYELRRQVGYTLATGEVTVVSDFEAEERFGVPIFFRDQRSGSSVCAAIPGSTGWWGVVLVVDDAPRDYEAGEVAFVQAAAGLLASAVTRERYERELAAQTERLMVTLRSIGDAVLTTDVHGQVALVNAAAERLTGWSQEEARGRPIAEVFPRRDEATGAALEDPVAQVLRAEGAAVSASSILIARDRSERVITDTVAAIRRADGDVIGAVVVFRDETEARALQRERERTGKLQALGLVAGGVAHDFNNLLGTISGNLELARRHPSQAEARLAQAAEAAARAAELTRRLLQFARGERPTPAARSVADELHDRVRDACAGSDHRCEVDIPVDLWPVGIGGGELAQIVQNLVQNGLQAMDRPGVLTVRARRERIDEARGALPPGQYVVIEVTDRGRGIAPADLGRIFDPFVTTRQGGTGLGLAIVADVVRRIAGHVEVESELGSGSTFRVWLPTAEARAEGSGAGAGPARLEEEHSRLLVTLNAIGDGVIVTDAEGRVTMMNPIAEEHTGWTRADAIGRPAREVFRVVDELGRTLPDDPVEKVLRTSVGSGLHDHTVLVARDGERYPIAHTASPIVLPEGHLVGCVLVFRDMRSSRQLEEEMLKSTRIAAVGTLAGRIAHDFNNALAAIVGGATVALRRLDADHPARGALDVVLAASARAQDVTRELVTFARGGAPVREPVDVVPVVRKLVADVMPDARWTAAVEAARDVPAAVVDPGQLRQVVQNLLRNAVQAQPEGGRVVVRVEAADLTAAQSMPLQAGRYVRIAVEDDGVGMPAEDLPRIFDPFYSSRPGAAGLGLATVHSIVSAHGGYVSAESQVGRGTRFQVYLPAGGPPRPAEVPKVPSLGGGRVLVMDDEPLVREIASRMLTELGFSVDTAAEGHAAIDAYRAAMAEGRPYRLVILDLSVPVGMGGAEAIAALRTLDPGVTAIVSSGYSDAPVMANHAAYGFAGVLRKPYGMDDLVGRLGAVLNS